MVDNQNNEIIERLLQQTKSPDVVKLKNISNTIQPIIDVTPVNSETVIRQVTRATTGVDIVYSTPTDKDFYLTSAALSYVKDVNCDIATGTIILEGDLFDKRSVNILTLPVITLTAQQGATNITFPIPIKMARNQSITLPNTFTAGVLIRCATISGFLVNTLNTE